MEIDTETERRAIYCIAATFLPQAADAKRASAFETGAKVYCFPPNIAGAYESVKAIGPALRGGKLSEALVPARDLTSWRAEVVRDAEVIRQISPPWDASEVSRNVAKGVAAWKSGGPLPAAEIREWNRAQATTQVGPDTLFGRVRGLIGKALGRE
ncbi:MAG TPA: hypothetical protein VGI81_26305 [Tepidisphaeraceae bacterium]|jgi:hypothetical protein